MLSGRLLIPALVVGLALGAAVPVLAVHNGGGNNKVTLCHNGHTITVGAPAVPAHLRQGDTLGPCVGGTPTQTVAATATGTAQATPTDTPTATATGAAQVTPTDTPMATATGTAQVAPTDTPTPTATDTATDTPTITVTGTPGAAITTLNAVDAALTLQYVDGLVVSLPNFERADLNHDGVVNSIDAEIILQMVAGLLG
jgi:hypothetical protein